MHGNSLTTDFPLFCRRAALLIGVTSTSEEGANMILTKSRKLIRKFVILGVLLGCLGLVSTELGTKASTRSSFKPCCSVCEPDPTIPICQHGCIEGCRN